MSRVQNWTLDKAETHFNASLIGQVSSWLADALDEMRWRRRGAAPVVASARATDRPVEAKPARPGIFARLETRFWRQEQDRREAWLAQSRDIFELEQRIQYLDRERTGL